MKINRTNFDAFIDMGSSVCTVRASVVLREGWAMERSVVRLGDFRDIQMKALGCVKKECILRTLDR